MSQELFEYIRQDTKERFDKLDDRLDTMDTKIDEIIKYKWQIVGGSLVVSALIGIVGFFITLAFK
jgi:hypothetical protein